MSNLWRSDELIPTRNFDKRSKTMTSITSILLSFFSVALMIQGPAHYKVEGRYAVPGDGGFDYVTLDTSSRRLYLSHATQVDVVDADSGKVVGTIPDTPGV